MSSKILMPALSPTMTEGAINKWLVKIGDNVKAGDIIAEIETDKATMEVEAVAEGKITHLLEEDPNIQVPVNSVIAIIDGKESDSLEKHSLTKDMLKIMKRGSVIVDVAIDQGGCVETSKPTTHAEPTYIIDDVVHYCVANMPGGVPRTSTIALNNATLPFLTKLANEGYVKALKDDPNFLAGLNVYKGQVTFKAVADAFGHNYVSAKEALN